MQTLDKPVDDQHDEHAIDQLIPRPPSRPKRFATGVALVAGCVAFGWAWGTGAIIPKPLGGTTSGTYGGVKVVEDIDSDRVILGSLPLVNHSGHDLVVTDVQIVGLPVTIDEVLWTPNGLIGGPVRQFFVSGDQPLPAQATPEGERPSNEATDGTVTVEAMEAIPGSDPVLDLYLVPDCDAQWPEQGQAAGQLLLRYEYPDRPAFIHTWFEFEQPLWDVDQSQRRGLISTSALNAADESVEIESLRDTMCGFAGASS